MSMEMNKAPVEQAVGDERAAFEAWLAQAMSNHFDPDFDLAKYEDSGEYRYNPAADYWKAWQARAALAQPSPDAPYADGIAADLERSDWTPEDALRWYAAGKHFDTTNGRTRIIDTGAVASNALKHLSLPYLEMKGDAELTELREAFAQPSPAQAEHAEAERPEVVARVVHSNPVVLGQCGPLNANDELMTVAQHAASVARWAEMFNRVEQQRDSALARVAELEGKLTDWVHEGFRLNEALAMACDAASKGDAARHAACGMEMEIQELREKVTELRKELRSRWTYASTQATNCAGCGEHKHTPLRVDWMGGYVCLTCIDKKLEELHDDQAQHSVPEELRAICMLVAETGIKYGRGRHRAVASDECRAVVNAVLNADLSVGRACEYAGCCDKAHPGTSLCIAHHSKKAREQLLAAAPGKEVGHE